MLVYAGFLVSKCLLAALLEGLGKGRGNEGCRMDADRLNYIKKKFSEHCAANKIGRCPFVLPHSGYGYFWPRNSTGPPVVATRAWEQVWMSPFSVTEAVRGELHKQTPHMKNRTRCPWMVRRENQTTTRIRELLFLESHGNIMPAASRQAVSCLAHPQERGKLGNDNY